MALDRIHDGCTLDPSAWPHLLHRRHSDNRGQANPMASVSTPLPWLLPELCAHHLQELVSKLSVPHSPHQSRRRPPLLPIPLPGSRSTGDSQHKHSTSPSPSPYPGPFYRPQLRVHASWGQFTDVAMETCIDGKTSPRNSCIMEHSQNFHF